MGFLRALSRIILGVVFILSGFLKAIDPVGSGLKIKEYLTAFHLGWLDFISLPTGVGFAILEFIIGVAILKGLRMRFFSLVALVFMSFFTLLTLYSAIFSPVQDCGCFGEAIHLTNWQTFYKNLLLLVCALLLYFQRDNFKPVGTLFIERLFVAIYSLIIILVTVYAIINVPQIDFGEYKAGTNILEYDGYQEQEYNTTFVYSKDGKEQEFTLENLPDTSWLFVDAKTTLVTVDEQAKFNKDFVLKNKMGEYVGQEILNTDKPIFFITIYKNKPLSAKRLNKISLLYNLLLQNGAQLYIVSGVSQEATMEYLKKIPEIPVLYSDYKNVLSFNRSNRGLTYIYQGTIIAKWSAYKYPNPNKIQELLKRDPEIILTKQIINEQLFAEIFLAVIFFLIIILRYIFRNLLGKYFDKLKSIESIE